MLASVSSAMAILLSITETVVSISSVVLPAAFADSLARFFTCSATTANPLPASPALAASIAAFRASRFVWDAMSSIASMIVPICSEHRPISWIDPFNSCSFLLPFASVSPADEAMLADASASRAFTSILFVMASKAVISSDTWAACSVQFSARSCAAKASCSEPLSICPETLRIVLSVSLIFSAICRSDSLIDTNSPT